MNLIELLEATKEHLAIIPDKSELIEAARLLTSGSKIVIAIDPFPPNFAVMCHSQAC